MQSHTNIKAHVYMHAYMHISVVNMDPDPIDKGITFLEVWAVVLIEDLLMKTYSCLMGLFYFYLTTLTDL